MSIVLASINIEGDKHLDTVFSFLEKEKPDVFCLQELRQMHIRLLEEHFGVRCHFAPMLKRADSDNAIEGVGIFSALDMTNTESFFYYGSEHALPESNKSVMDPRVEKSYPVAFADIEKDGVIYRVATTHFPWTPDGSASGFQRECLAAMLQVLGSKEEFILCGDFNAPRGREVFSVLSERYTDTIPLHYDTSLDAVLHRAGHLKLMVDGLFTTKGYRAEQVTLVDGVSDHCAVLGTIRKYN